MKNILISGGTGFLGHHLIEHLVASEKKIIALVRQKSVATNFDNSIKLFDQDDENNLLSLIDEIDCVLHLATSYGRNRETKKEVYETNLDYSLKVLDIAKKIKAKHFINFDTSLPKHVNHYSSSKAAFRNILKENATDSLKIVNLRIETIYGPNKKGNDFTNILMKACLNNKDILELSKCEQVRDFIFYEDLILCVGLILDNLNKFPNFVNFQVGSGKGVPLKEFATLFKKLSKSTTKLDFGKIPYRKNEIMNSVSEINNLKYIGWSPKTSLEDGMKKIILNLTNGRSS
jgi:CDP-paratose synthetase